MKKVLITGAGRGIGLALSKEFTAKGYAVLATYRSEKSANELLQFAKAHPTVSLVTADVTEEKSFSALKTLLEKTAPIDILINNSGVIGDKGRAFAELDLQVVADTFKVNTFGPMLVTKLALPFLQEKACIVQISSQMGSIADSSGGYYDYRMSKTALNMFNHCLAKEFPKRICLSLHPGWVQTEMGGPGAKLSTVESAQGLYQVIVNATNKQSGQFIDYSGKLLPW